MDRTDAPHGGYVARLHSKAKPRSDKSPADPPPPGIDCHQDQTRYKEYGTHTAPPPKYSVVVTTYRRCRA